MKAEIVNPKGGGLRKEKELDLPGHGMQDLQRNWPELTAL